MRPVMPGFAYQPIDTGDGAVFQKDGQSGASERTCVDTRGKVFNMLVAFVLLANVIFLCLEADLDLLGEDAQHWGGLERDMGLLGINHAQQAGVEAEIQDGLVADQRVKANLKSALQQDVKSMLHENIDIHGELNSGSYSVVEFFFVAFYFLEVFIRLCDVGCAAYCRDLWFYVDVAVVLAGVADLSLPIVMPQSDSRTLEEILRLVRVLRILRLFRVVPALRTVGRAFLNALYTVLWILALIAIINLVCAVFLTTFIGQRAHLWEDHAVEVHSWFGSLLRSMMTLSMIMTLAGWDHIIGVLVLVIPRLAVMAAIFVYIFMCGFTMLGLISGMINTTFVSSQLEDERLYSQGEQEKRGIFASAFADVLATCDQSKSGSLTREEFCAALESYPAVFLQLQLLGIDTNIDALLHVFDRLSQVPSFDGTIKAAHLVEATSHLGAKANAAGVFELKYHLLGMRQDTGKQVSDMARAISAKHEMTSAAIEGRFAEVQEVVAKMQRELSASCQATTAVSQKVEALERLEERERSRQNDTMSATNSKLDGVFSQINSTLFTLNSRVAAQSGMVEKIENLSVHVTSQAAVKEKIHEIATQLAAAQTTMHEKVNVLAAQFAQDGASERLEKLWPLYEAKMKKGGKESNTSAAISAFKHKFTALVLGVAPVIPECSLAPVATLPDFEKLEITERPALLQKTVVLKLNGGLGNLDRAISSVSIAGQHTCLDLIAKQVEWTKIEHKQPNLQFMLMTSSSSSQDKKALSMYPILGSSDLEFVQNKAPKIHSTDMSPVDWPANVDYEWCPAGSGDLFASMVGSGMLDKLIENGMKYMFVSNSDNLGATVDPKLLTHFVESGAPLMMEVAVRTAADKKRGHLATLKKTGDMTMREAAQCSNDDESAFQDTSKYGYFSTNNLWINLGKLKALFDKHDGTIPLPVMISEKTVDPNDKNSAKVIHLEAAMGAAISCFEGATAVLTSRRRFLPVETCEDLFALRSDAYVVAPDFQLELVPERNGLPPIVKLDEMYSRVDAMDSLIPNGVPSLKDCNSLQIEGPMDFAAGVIIKGDVTIKSIQKATVPQGTYKDQVITL